MWNWKKFMLNWKTLLAFLEDSVNRTDYTEIQQIISQQKRWDAGGLGDQYPPKGYAARGFWGVRRFFVSGRAPEGVPGGVPEGVSGRSLECGTFVIFKIRKRIDFGLNNGYGLF